MSVAVGCGEEAAVATPSHGGPFVLDPDWPSHADGVASIRGSIAFAAGDDPYPEYARAFRCLLKDQEVVGELQYSAAAPTAVGLGFRFHDPASGKVFQSDRPTRGQAFLERPDDRRFGRETFVTSIRAPGFHPGKDIQRWLRFADCQATVHLFTN